jgi:MraZ protein
MLLTGTYIRSLDDKLRLAIPKPVRDSLGYPSNSVFYLAPGTDGSLALYSERAFSQLAERLDQTSPNRQETRAFSRLFYAQAQRVELDRQGRVRIPLELAQFAGLEREIVLLGVRDHLEIWNRRQWDAYLGRQQGHYDEIAETAFDGGSRVRENRPSETPTVQETPGDRPVQPR